jgi:putative tricarboxylic transport membrane protein
VTPRSRPQILIGAGVAALAVIVGVETTQIPVTPMYSRVGPAVFPYLVAGGLFILGLLLAFEAATGRWGETDADVETSPPDRRALAWLGLGLVLNVALIDVFGFIVASTLLFVCTARAFGSTRPARDAGIAVLLTLITYLGFDRLLGISIGAGIFEGLL